MMARSLTVRSESIKSAMAVRAEPGVRDLLRLEYLKTVKRRMTRVVFGIIVLLMGGIVALRYLFGYVLESDPDAEITEMLMPVIIEDSLEIISVLGPILIVILAAGLAGSEFSWGTVRTMVGTGVSRAKLLLAKLVVVCVASILLVVTGLATVALTTTVISPIEGHGLRMSWIDFASAGDVTLMVLRSSFIMAVYGVLGFAIAQTTRSVAAGIAVGIGIHVVGPILWALSSLLGGFGEFIDDSFIITNTEVLNALNTFGTPEPPEGAPGPWLAAGTLLAYAAIAVAISLASFKRRDISVD